MPPARRRRRRRQPASQPQSAVAAPGARVQPFAPDHLGGRGSVGGHVRLEGDGGVRRDGVSGLERAYGARLREGAKGLRACGRRRGAVTHVLLGTWLVSCPCSWGRELCVRAPRVGAAGFFHRVASSDREACRTHFSFGGGTIALYTRVNGTRLFRDERDNQIQKIDRPRNGDGRRATADAQKRMHTFADATTGEK